MKWFDEIDKLARNIEHHAFRRGYVSAFTLTAFPAGQDGDLAVHITRECDGLVYGNAEVGSAVAFGECVKALDGRVDYIVCDIALPVNLAEFRTGGVKALKNSIVLPYSDLDVWVDSVKYTLLADISDLASKCVVILGAENTGDALMSKLGARIADYCKKMSTHKISTNNGEENDIVPVETLSEADIIIGGAIYRQVIRRRHLVECSKKLLLVDAGIGTITPDASEYAAEQGMVMIRVDNRAAMAGTLFSLIQSFDLVSRVMGTGEIAGVTVVAGGIIGAPGTIVVDSIDRPSIAIGFADGTGRIRYEPLNEDESGRIEKVRDYIREG